MAVAEFAWLNTKTPISIKPRKNFIKKFYVNLIQKKMFKLQIYSKIFTHD